MDLIGFIDLPGSPRTQIGFITFDNTVHFYNLKVYTQLLLIGLESDVLFFLQVVTIKAKHDGCA